MPPSDKIRLRRLIRLMFTMVVDRLTDRMAFDGSEQKKHADQARGIPSIETSEIDRRLRMASPFPRDIVSDFR